MIQETINCIARKGSASTTLSDVATEAGLSQGIVNLHFKSKHNLLTETLTWLADLYASNREKDLARSGNSSRERLTAIVESDFKTAVFNPRMIAVWYAFLGEAKARPTYQKICDDYLQPNGKAPAKYNG